MHHNITADTMKITASFSLIVPALLSGTAYGFGLGMPGQAHALRLPTSAAAATSLVSASNTRLAMSAVADEVEAKKDTEEAVSYLLV